MKATIYLIILGALILGGIFILDKGFEWNIFSSKSKVLNETRNSLIEPTPLDFTTVLSFPTPALNTEENFQDYLVVNRNDNIIITKQQSDCLIYTTHRTCTHEFQFYFTDGTNTSLVIEWDSGQWDSDFFHLNTSSPTLLSFSKINPQNIRAKYSNNFNIVNTSWENLLWSDEYQMEYTEFIVLPIKQYYEYENLNNLNQIKRSILKNQDLTI